MGRFVAGVAVVGLLMAAACGDDDGSSSQAIAEFCAGFNEINDEFSGINPVADPEALENALEMLRDLDPPDEIADDYETVLEGFQRLSEIDLTDRAAVAQVQEELPAAEDAFNTVGDFVEEEC